MVELEPYVIDSLKVAKQIYDMGRSEAFLKECGSLLLDDDFYSVSWFGMCAVFEKTDVYYHAAHELEVLVFYDPVISDFYRLCELYELRRGISSEENTYRKRMEESVCRDLYLSAYDYDARLYPGRRGRGSRLVMLLGEEFCGHCELPSALFDVYCTVENQICILKQELERCAEAGAGNALAVPTGKEAV